MADAAAAAASPPPAVAPSMSAALVLLAPPAPPRKSVSPDATARRKPLGALTRHEFLTDLVRPRLWHATPARACEPSRRAYPRLSVTTHAADARFASQIAFLKDKGQGALVQAGGTRSQPRLRGRTKSAATRQRSALSARGLACGAEAPLCAVSCARLAQLIRDTQRRKTRCSFPRKS